MLFGKLETLVIRFAKMQKEGAGYSGMWGDGGSGSTLSRLQNYKCKLINKYDLRPSEYYKLSEIEIGEPSEFQEVIDKEKQKLASNIKL